MRGLRFLIILVSVLSLIAIAYAAGNVEKGKALFNDPKLGTSGKSCNSCHPDGKGLEQAGTKKEFNLMGKSQKSLEEAVNFCIEMALKGKAIDPKGSDMANIVTYIKSLSGKAAPKKKKAIEGC
ncbi:MAG: cytochrome c peroxidase [Thermodesulfovibrionales bacterium]